MKINVNELLDQDCHLISTKPECTEKRSVGIWARRRGIKTVKVRTALSSPCLDGQTDNGQDTDNAVRRRLIWTGNSSIRIEIE